MKRKMFLQVKLKCLESVEPITNTGATRASGNNSLQLFASALYPIDFFLATGEAL